MEKEVKKHETLAIAKPMLPAVFFDGSGNVL
jgi:hypothetical protein